MTQSATVKRLYDDNWAEVCVTRQTACGGNCTSCEGCALAGDIIALAVNTIGAKPGQKVLISTETNKVFGAAIIVYLLPILLFILGYIVSASLGLREVACIVVSFLTLILSASIAFLVNKRAGTKGSVTYSIVKIVEGL